MTNDRRCAALMLLALVFDGALYARPQVRDPENRLEQTDVRKTEPALAGNCVADKAREKAALQVLLNSVKSQITSVAEAMPADKYSFKPTEGEFQGVRSFGQQVKHLAATNQILAAAALGEAPPEGAGDEAGPETARTKTEILAYLNASFAQLRRGIDAISNPEVMVKSSPISPLKESAVTRESLLVEALVHSFDHYGQMVEYLRMNGVVPPASLP